MSDLTLLAPALGWTLAHSIWQIAVVFVVFKAGGLALGRSNRAHYAWALAAMALCAGWSVRTFAGQLERLERAQAEQTLFAPLSARQAAEVGLAPEVFSRYDAAAPALETTAVERAWAATLAWLDTHAPTLAGLWCIGVLVLSLRLLGGYFVARRWRQTCPRICAAARR